MKKFFILLLSVLALNACLSQTGDTPKNRGFRKADIFHKDSFAIKLQGIKDSLEKTLQEVKRQEDIGKNVEALLKISNKNKAKEKRGAMIRIGLGLAFLALLIVGLLRRRAKK